MQLDKWSANDSLDENEMVSTLGLKWLPQSDCFCFKVSLGIKPSIITKRTMLSEIAGLFDPLGWLAPIIIRCKIMIQELWIRGLDWDTPVDEDIKGAWTSIRMQLSHISQLRIPRWFLTNKDSFWELHGFSDASQRAYAAVIYLVYKYNSEVYKVFLISAKSKVAPVKTMAIPRLELC